MSRVYANLPTTAPGGDVMRGAELAAEGTGIELVAGGASEALSDPDTLAYLGDFFSRDILESAPLLSAAGILQVAPVATYIGLGGSSLVLLMPHDGVGARVIAEWLVQADVHDLLVVHDHDYDYGISVGTMCADAARARGLDVRIQPVWDHDEDMHAELGSPQALLYIGVPGSGAGGLWRDLHTALPDAWLLGHDGLAMDWFARELDAGAAERTRIFHSAWAPWGFYGYEAMRLIVDAIAAGGDDRAEIVRFARSVRDRDSILGRYSVDPDGHTTSTAYGRLAVAGGELVWDRRW